MINRTLIRTRVIQTLYAYVEDGDMSLTTAKKMLTRSFDDTYSLYFLLLDFPYALTRYAQEVYEDTQARTRATHEVFNLSRNFIDNKFADTIFRSSSIQNEIEKRKLSWDPAHTVVAAIYKQLSESEAFARYMQITNPTFADDKSIWKHIVTNIMANNDLLQEAMEELELVCDASHWLTDIDIVLSYVTKTLRTIKEGEEVVVMPLFDTDEEDSDKKADDKAFAAPLLEAAIDQYEANQELIASHLRGWDINNIVFMDRLIISTALAEITTFSEIPLQISLNEYINLTKEYSSEKSPTFVNGTLTSILKDLHAEGKLPKAANIR